MLICVCIASGVMGSVQRSVDESFVPCKITLLLYFTSHDASVNVTSQPALHSTLIPKRDAIAKPGTMCPVRTFGNPGMILSHTCVDFTMPPFGRLILRGAAVVRTLFMGVPAMTNMEVAPVSAMECDVGTVNSTALGMANAAFCCFGDKLDAATVISSIRLILMGSKAYCVISFIL